MNIKIEMVSFSIVWGQAHYVNFQTLFSGNHVHCSFTHFFFAKIFLHCTSVVDRGMCRNKYGHGNKYMYSHDPWMYTVNKLINRLIAVTRL